MKKYEAIYLQKKDRGALGWQEEEDYIEIIGWLSKLLNWSNKKSGKVLELGCGAGNISMYLAKSGYQLTGIDISPTAIKWAKQRFKKLNLTGDFFEGNVTELQIFKDQSFDMLVDSLCLHCLIGDDRKKFLQEAYRVLTADGVFLIISMCGDPKNEFLKPHFDRASRYVFFNDLPECYFGTLDHLLTELEGAGFRVQHYLLVAGNENEGQQDMLLAIGTKLDQLE